MNNSRLNALIVDGSDLVRKRVMQIIREIPRIDFIYHAVDAESANDIITNIKPEIIVLDINLSKGSGFDVLKYLKTKSPNTSIVIMLSNVATNWHRKKCYDLGADFFLDKTNEFDLLSQIVAAIFKNYQSIQPSLPLKSN